MSKNYSDSTLIKSVQIYKHFLIWQIFLFFFFTKNANNLCLSTPNSPVKKNITMLLLTVA